MDAHDHRVLGPKLDLFHQQDEAPGIAFWHPRGATIYRLIESYLHDEMSQLGFSEVRTPQLLSRSLWERSGHWENFDAEYIDSNGDRLRPVMIHHAVMGSVERFLAVLLEHHRGRLPFWLAPEQIAVAPISEGQSSYVHSIEKSLSAEGFRCTLAQPNGTLSRRIVEAKDKGIPIFITVGRKGIFTSTVSIRDSNGQQSIWSVADAIEWLKELRESM